MWRFFFRWICFALPRLSLCWQCCQLCIILEKLEHTIRNAWFHRLNFKSDECGWHSCFNKFVLFCYKGKPNKGIALRRFELRAKEHSREIHQFKLFPLSRNKRKLFLIEAKNWKLFISKFWKEICVVGNICRKHKLQRKYMWYIWTLLEVITNILVNCYSVTFQNYQTLFLRCGFILKVIFHIQYLFLYQTGFYGIILFYIEIVTTVEYTFEIFIIITFFHFALLLFLSTRKLVETY